MNPLNLSDLNAVPKDSNHVRNRASSAMGSADGVENVPEQSDLDVDE